MRRYTLHQISPVSLFKFGCAIGAIISVLPLACITIVIFQAVASLARWLNSLVYRIQLPLLGDFEINVVELLHLQGLKESAIGWASLGIIEVLLILAFLTLVLAISWGLLAGLVGLFFNLISTITGGLKVSLSEESLQPVMNILAAADEPPLSSQTGDDSTQPGAD